MWSIKKCIQKVTCKAITSHPSLFIRPASAAAAVASLFAQKQREIIGSAEKRAAKFFPMHKTALFTCRR